LFAGRRVIFQAIKQAIENSFSIDFDIFKSLLKFIIYLLRPIGNSVKMFVVAAVEIFIIAAAGFINFFN